MNEIYVDLRKLDLADRLGKDMISVDYLLRELEDALDRIDDLKEQIKELEEPEDEDIDGYIKDKRMGII